MMTSATGVGPGGGLEEQLSPVGTAGSGASGDKAGKVPSLPATPRAAVVPPEGGSGPKKTPGPGRTPSAAGRAPSKPYEMSRRMREALKTLQDIAQVCLPFDCLPFDWSQARDICQLGEVGGYCERFGYCICRRVQMEWKG